MLSNAYFLAKFRFDTAENEPAKNLQNFQKNAFFRRGPGRGGPAARRGPPRWRRAPAARRAGPGARSRGAAQAPAAGPGLLQNATKFANVGSHKTVNFFFVNWSY